MRHQPDQFAGFSGVVIAHPALRLIPVALTSLRLALAPMVLAAAFGHWPGAVFVICLVVAFVSDVYDGKIARRLGVATPALRRYDSLTDVAFYLSILFSAWMLYRAELRGFTWGIVLVLCLDFLCHLASLIRFGRPASTHCYSAKAWGILLFASFIDLLGFGEAGLLWITIGWGCVADLETLMIILMAPTWPSDVRSVFHARRLWRSSAGSV